MEQQLTAERERQDELAARNNKLNKKLDKVKRELTAVKHELTAVNSQLQQTRHDKVPIYYSIGGVDPGGWGA